MYNGTIVAAGGRNGDIAVVRVNAAGAVLAADVYDLGGVETGYGVAVNALGVAVVVASATARASRRRIWPTARPTPS